MNMNRILKEPTLRAQGGYSLDQIPRDSGVPVNNPVDSSELSRNLNNGLNALGGMGVVASTPLRGAQAASGAANAGSRGMNAAPILTNGAPRLAAPAARAAPDFIAGVGEGATVVGRAASNLPATVPGGSRALSLTDNAVNATKATNVALQEGAQANSMAALTRTAANANAASSAGGNALNGALPAQPFYSQVPSAVAAPAQTAAPAGPSAKAYSLRQGTLGENDNAYHGDLTGKINAAMKSSQTDLASTGMRANDIYKTKSANGTTSYSGYGDGSGRLGNLVSGDGTELRGRGSVSSVPAGSMSQSATAQTLRNPNGSTWSAQDNAIMAANLRDGVNPTQGTSGGQMGGATIIGDGGGYGLLSKEYQAKRNAPQIDMRGLSQRQKAQYMIAAEETAIKRQANEYGNEDSLRRDGTSRRGQDMTASTAKMGNDTTLRGQDMDYAGKRIANESNKLRLQYDMGKDQRDFALTKATHDQSMGQKYRENFKKEFQVAGADGKPDEIASGQMADTARRLFPGIESADEKTRNAAMADAKELTGIFQKARSQDKVGFDALKFWEPKRAELSGMPDATGGRVETLSGLGGAVTLGASNGDTTLTKDGKTVNLGRLNQRQLELLNTAQKTNWGN